MAGIDRIYGTLEQRRELKRFIRRLRIPGYRKRACRRGHESGWRNNTTGRL